MANLDPDNTHLRQITSILNEQTMGSHNTQRQFSVQPNISRKKFTPEQLLILTEFFKANQYPNRAEFEQLARSVNDDITRIRYWFAAERKRAVKRNPQFQKAYTRQNFSREQRVSLKGFFLDVSRYPTAAQIQFLAEKIGDSEARVRQWFLYTREQVKKKGYLLQEEPCPAQDPNRTAVTAASAFRTQRSDTYENQPSTSTMPSTTLEQLTRQASLDLTKYQFTNPTQFAADLLTQMQKSPSTIQTFSNGLVPLAERAAAASKLPMVMKTEPTDHESSPNILDSLLNASMNNIQTSRAVDAGTNSPATSGSAQSVSSSSGRENVLNVNKTSPTGGRPKMPVTLVFGEERDVSQLSKTKVDFIRDHIFDGSSRVRSSVAFSGTVLADIQKLNLGSIDPNTVHNIIFDLSKFPLDTKFPFLNSSQTVDDICKNQSDPDFVTRIGNFYGICGAGTKLFYDWIFALRLRFPQVEHLIAITDDHACISLKMIMYFLSQDSRLGFSLLSSGTGRNDSLSVSSDDPDDSTSNGSWFIQQVSCAAMSIQARRIVQNVSQNIEESEQKAKEGEGSTDQATFDVENFSSDDE